MVVLAVRCLLLLNNLNVHQPINLNRFVRCRFNRCLGEQCTGRKKTTIKKRNRTLAGNPLELTTRTRNNVAIRYLAD